ncbi:hypothetical protein LQ954_02000 [Sphingomonas sp. IC-11]|uniref:hypothetical protein n=1 Tax=Sphingomonas sp. IC-11 TaxID=2898528 RepID=UPI001E39FA9F|nr:hypothetical protein [Sphingomonas sp. IC-11]MCD2314917.1 hypothetical protein [Sphingomonas sp. IC-11]
MASHSSTNSGSWYLLRVRRYLLAALGPVVLAGTHFLLSFAMLRLETPAAFGTFTFLFVAAQFTVALSMALFGAPLQTISAGTVQDRAGSVASILSATVLAAVILAVAFGLLAGAMELPTPAALCYGLYTAMMILRWVGRAWAYANDQAGRAAVSDVSYGAITLLAFGAAAYLIRFTPETACYGALALGAASSLLAFGAPYLSQLLARPGRQSWRFYRGVWQSRSRWALLGVLASEAAANTHVYLVTLTSGAAAMAPLAAAALLLRPLNVVQNALGEYERPQMARLIAAGKTSELRRTVRLFFWVLMLGWLAAVALAIGVLCLAPHLVFPPDYDLDLVRLATLSWISVTLLIMMQVPANIMVQASGGFRQLARTVIWSSLVNVAAVVIALVFFAPVWTIVAMALGWLVDLVLVQRAARRQWAAMPSE